MDMKKAMARIEGLQDYLVDMLSKIIAVDTSVPPGLNYDKLIDIVEPEFQALGFETKRVVMPRSWWSRSLKSSKEIGSTWWPA